MGDANKIYDQAFERGNLRLNGVGDVAHQFGSLVGCGDCRETRVGGGGRAIIAADGLACYRAAHRPHSVQRAKITSIAAARVAGSKSLAVVASSVSSAAVTVAAHRLTASWDWPIETIIAASARCTARMALSPAPGGAWPAGSKSLRTSISRRLGVVVLARDGSHRPATSILKRVLDIRPPKGCKSCTARPHGQAVYQPSSNSFASRSAHIKAGSSAVSGERRASVASINLARNTSPKPSRSKVSATAVASMLRARVVDGSNIGTLYSAADHYGDKARAVGARQIAVPCRLPVDTAHTSAGNPNRGCGAGGVA